MSTWNSTDGAPGPSPTCKSFSAWWLSSFLLQPDWILVVGWEGPPKDVHVLVPGACEQYLIWQKRHGRGAVSAGMPEGLEMKRLSWIIQVTLPISMCILMRGKKRETGTLTEEEETWGRNWSDVAISQRMPGPPAAGESGEPILP